MNPFGDETFGSIERAAEVLRGIAPVTPVVTSWRLDEISGTYAFLKCEHLERIGAFKFRGAYNAVAHWTTTSSHRVFATVSSGNHAQGLALACRLLGGTAHIVMLKASSHLKQQAVRSFGATVYEADDRSQAITLLDRLAQELPAVIVHPFNDPLVIAGQGTAMIELLGQVADLDLVVAPVGGGGLLSGLCIAA